MTALGSGGTVAGLVAGLASAGMRTRVLGVTVADPAWFVDRMTRALACKCAPEFRRREVLARLEHERGYLGAGYGHSTEKGRAAIAAGAALGIELEQTYTGKAFAAALDRVALGRERTILYWHTFSSAPMAPLLEKAPEEAAIDEKLLRLLRHEHEIVRTSG